MKYAQPVQWSAVMTRSDQLPTPTLVYACSGCASAAQLANHLAVRLDRNGDAEMSCIAGVGGRVKPLIRIARRAVEEGRPILAIDGCPLACAKNSLAQIDIVPTLHLQLAEYDVRKTAHADFDPQQAQALLTRCTQRVHDLNAAYLERDAMAVLPAA